MATRKNFSFRYEWSERIAHLSDTVQFQILAGTVAYAKTGEFPAEACDEAREAFEEHILPDFRKRAKAAEYRARAKARKAAAQAASASMSHEAAVAPAQSAPASGAADKAAELPVTPPPAPLSRAERRRLEKMKRRKLSRSRFS